jgi:hypothetical protein
MEADLVERRPKKYLRKKAVAKRYGDVNERSIPRMVADGRLPPPDLYNGRFPLWAEDTLDAHDRAQRSKPRPHRSDQPDPPKPHATAPALPGRRPFGSDIRRR